MTLKEKFVEFNKIAPLQTSTILDRPFSYRYYKNPDSSKKMLR